MKENKMGDRTKSVPSSKSVYSASSKGGSKVTGKSRSTNEFKQQQMKRTNLDIYGERHKVKPNVHNFKYQSPTLQHTSSTFRRKMYDAFLSQKELTLSKHRMKTGRSLQNPFGNSLAGAINTKFTKLARKLDDKLLKPSLKHTMPRSMSMNSPNMNYSELSYNWLDTTPTAMPVAELEHTKEFLKPCKKTQKKKTSKCESDTEMSTSKKITKKPPKIKHEPRVKRTLPSENISIKTKHRSKLDDLRKLIPVEKSNSLSLSPFSEDNIKQDRTKNDLYSFFVDLLETTFESNDMELKASNNTVETSSTQSSDTNTVLPAEDRTKEKTDLQKSASKTEYDLPKRVIEPRRVYQLPKVNIPSLYKNPKESFNDRPTRKQRRNITSISTLVQDHNPAVSSINKGKKRDAIVINAGPFSDPEESSTKIDLRKSKKKSSASGRYLNAVDPRTGRRVPNIMYRKKNILSSSARSRLVNTNLQPASTKSSKKIKNPKNHIVSFLQDDLLQEEDGNLQLFKSLKNIVEGVRRREKSLRTPPSDEMLTKGSKDFLKCKLRSRKLMKTNKRRRSRKPKPKNLQMNKRQTKRIPLKTSMREMTPTRSRTPKSRSHTPRSWSQPPKSRSLTSKSIPYSPQSRPLTPRSQTSRPQSPKARMLPFDLSDDDMSYHSMKVFEYESGKKKRRKPVRKETEMLTLDYTSSEAHLKEDPSLQFMVTKGVNSSDIESSENRTAFEDVPQSWMEKMGKDWKIPTL